MNYLVVFFEVIFAFSEVIIAIFSLHYCYIVLRNLVLPKQGEDESVQTEQEVAFVTFQVPIFNEKHIVREFIANIVNIDYPSDRFEVQLLDDSTDETSCLIKNEIKKYPSINFLHIKRSIRTDFKAGALNEGLITAKGTFIAIFDIDFKPPRDFLRKTLPNFHENEKLAFVQTRWGHKNKESTLTEAIALGIDNHFLIEQPVRNNIGVMNFNGTCGIFRKDAIIDAGLWDGSILAEDLDLSYRLYMKNWTAKYSENVVCQGEIPNKISSYKTQQYRWAKGSSQASRKNLSSIMRSKELSHTQKAESIFHHLGYFIQLFIFINILSTIPLLYYQSAILLANWGILLFIINSLASTMYLLTSFKLKMNLMATIKSIFILTMITVGISWKTSIATIEGLFHRSGEFKRTPKGISSNKSSYLTKSRIDLLIEISLIIYLLFGIGITIMHNSYIPILYLSFCLIAFSYIFMLDLNEQLNLETVSIRIPQSLKKIFGSSN